MIGFNERIEYRARHFFFCAGHRQIDDRCLMNRDVLVAQPFDDIVGRRDDLHAHDTQFVDHRRGTAAGSRHHCDALAPARLPVSHQRRDFKQRFQRVNSHHAMATEKCTGRLVAAGHGAAVRGRQLTPDT